LTARLAAAVAFLACAAAAQDAPLPAEPDPAIRTALVTFADGNTLPLRNWTLSYDYLSWTRGSSPATGIQARRESDALWIGKRVVPMGSARLDVRHGELRRETLVGGRPQPVVSSAAREITVTLADGKAIQAKVEPPHRDLLAPDAGKSTMVLARSLDLRGDGITGTRREVCLLSYTSLVECGGDPADKVVKVEFHR
jgi:hypothetical protein